MKKITPFIAFILLSLCFSFDEPYYYYSQYKPVFMLRSEMEKNIKIQSPRAIRETGKIYLKDNYIFINEKYRGIHVLDNSDPENPTPKAFINIDGCIDMAIKENVLYADNAVDLIALRFNPEISEIEVTKRIKNTFPELPAPDERQLTWKEQKAIPENAILVRWEKR